MKTKSKAQSETLREIEVAKIRLELLKENFEFRRLFKAHQADPPTLLAKLFERFDDLGCAFHDSAFDSAVQVEIAHPDLVNLLDPDKNLSGIPENLVAMLPWLLFYRGGIKHVRRQIKDLKPWQRAFVIDIRMRKADLLRQFEAFLDMEMTTKKAAHRLVNLGLPFEGYLLWDADNSRWRDEVQDCLKVWKLRKQGKSYQQIADALGIDKPTAKDRFYAAYKYTQGRPYDPHLYKNHLERQIAKANSPCNGCQDRGTCKESCPALELFVDRPYPQKELLLRPDLLDTVKIVDRGRKKQSKKIT
jgi:hypothetical protein